MARTVSTLEAHPQRQKIIEALVADTPYRKIAAWTDPPVTIATLSRYKQSAVATIRQSVIDAKKAIANRDKDLPESFESAVTRAALTVAVDPFLSRVAHLDAERARVKQVAEESKNLGAWSALDGNDLRALELHAKLAGRLDSGTHIQVSVVVPGQPGASAAPAVSEDDVTIIDIQPAR